MGGSYVDVSSEFENKDDLSMPCEQYDTGEGGVWKGPTIKYDVI